ncbi:unnamed protein product [Paramecium octaurelia]|uniref:TLDc domain-containing protein n=1 Tax=Paramecium octaurelia TaxID=43137 RepID=A0A8S1Y4U3_PAROT|nr:unnamed protein product [Paramecium octaurelia]
MEKCPIHKENITYLVLKPNSVQLACIECRDDLIREGHKWESCILLSKALKIPEVLLSKINIEPIFKTFFSKIILVSSEELELQKNLWITEFKRIMAELEKMITDTKDFFDHLSQTLVQYRTDLRRIIKFETFEQHIRGNQNDQNFNQVSSIIIYQHRQQTMGQIEQKIQEYINSISQESNCENKQIIEALIQDYRKKINNVKFPPSTEILNLLTNKFKTFEIAVDSRFKQANPNSTCSCLLSEINFENMKNRIKQNSNSAYSLIYQGSIDGLNPNNFWTKISSKSNLLMIMKTKNNNCVFGGYSPCQWYRTQQSQAMADQEGTSFIFVQSPNQQMYYYPIKKEYKLQAITLNQNFGPTFGKPDLQISADFKEGQLNLGNYYFRDPKENQLSFILGPKLEEIIECEVFQL